MSEPENAAPATTTSAKPTVVSKPKQHKISIGLYFFNPATEEVLFVEGAKAQAFLKECETTDALMENFLEAKQDYVKFQESILVSQDPTAKTKAAPSKPDETQQERDRKAAALEKARKALEGHVEPIGKFAEGKLMELVPLMNSQGHPILKGKKFTYVRSPKLKGHFRSYKLKDKDLPASGQGSSILQKDRKPGEGLLDKKGSSRNSGEG